MRDTMLYLSDARGQYIPRDFAQQTIRECVTGVDQTDWDTLLAGPDHEWYWEAWNSVCNDAIVTDPKSGQAYRIHQDGDCWLIPVEWEWDDATEWYIDPATREESGN